MKLRYTLPVLAAALVASAAANAATGYTTEGLNLRAGPGRDYPTIEGLGPVTKVTVYGCIERYDWCDVSKGRIRGWVDGDHLLIPFKGRRVKVIDAGRRIHLPVVAFDFDNYWNHHYRRASFYRDRASWRDKWRQWTGDRDHDHIPNAVDRDRDGDGVPNNRDRQPNNPRHN